MTPPTLLKQLRHRGVVLSVSGVSLEFWAPEGVVSADIRAELVRHKAAIIPLVETAWLPDGQKRPNFIDLGRRHGLAGYLETFRAVTGCDFPTDLPSWEQLFVFDAWLKREGR